MGKLISNSTQNSRVVQPPFKNSSVNHVCDVITPNVEGRSGVTFGRRGNVDDMPYLPLYYAAFGLRQQTIFAAPSTGSSQTRSSQRLRELDRDLEFIFGRKEAVQVVTYGREAVDDTPHVLVDTATAVDTAAAAVFQQTGDSASKKPKRSRLLRELECTLIWMDTGREEDHADRRG